MLVMVSTIVRCGLACIWLYAGDRNCNEIRTNVFLVPIFHNNWNRRITPNGVALNMIQEQIVNTVSKKRSEKEIEMKIAAKRSSDEVTALENEMKFVTCLMRYFVNTKWEFLKIAKVRK